MTVEAAEAVAGDFNWGWAACRLLSRPAWAEYSRAVILERAEYRRIATAAYRRVEAAARAEYLHIRIAAWDEYNRIATAAQAEYNRTTARTFARLYIAENTLSTEGKNDV